MTLMGEPFPTSLAARAERQFPLAARTPKADVLAHLHLLVEGQPTNAAVLLFGRDPQRFVSSAEVRCMHFHGTEIQRPAPYLPDIQGSALRAGGPGGGLRALRDQPQRRHPRPRAPRHRLPTKSPRTLCARPSSTPSPTATTPWQAQCRFPFSPTEWRSGTPACFRHR